MMKLRCAVAATTADGTPGFFFLRINCSNRDYNDGGHYDYAKEEAEEHGYEGEMVVFDENDGPEWLFADFPEDAPTFTIS
jgi:hypothetical protein